MPLQSLPEECRQRAVCSPGRPPGLRQQRRQGQLVVAVVELHGAHEGFEGAEVLDPQEIRLGDLVIAWRLAFL